MKTKTKPRKPRITNAPVPRCPHCGVVGVDNLRILETFTAYHTIKIATDVLGRPIDNGEATAVIAVNALGTECPSEHFDDGEADYRAHCVSCGKSGTLDEYNLNLVDWD